MNFNNWKTYGLIVIFLVTLRMDSVSSYFPRRIKFAGCYDNVEKPVAVFMSCANKRGDCEVRKGSHHILRIFFRPRFNSTEVESFGAWNSWIQVPIPNQDHNACNSMKSCPLEEGKLNAFTYKLLIETFWPSDAFPVIWTFTDKNSEKEILCLRFKIQIS